MKWWIIVGLLWLVGCRTVADDGAEAGTHDLAPSPMPPTAIPTQADADVIFVRAVETAVNTWTFYVTVAHPDTGWEDYADGWDVVLPDGTAVKPDADSPFTRLLLHPHETEQPFTRSQSLIMIPPEADQVTVRAHDSVDGFGGQEILVSLVRTVETEQYAVQKVTVSE